MDKAEAGRQQLLQALGTWADRPADEVLAPLTYCEIGVSPGIPLATVIARVDEFRERLLAEIMLSPAEVEARYQAAPDERHSYFLHTFALYLLGLWGEPRAFQPIVAYLAADSALADAQLQEIVTEDLPAILARSYDGSDLAPLKALIEDESVDEFLRGAALRSLRGMALLGKLPLAEVSAYYAMLADKLRTPENEAFGAEFVDALAALRDERLRPAIDRWFADGLVEAWVMRPSDVDRIYAEDYDVVREHVTGSERFDGLVDYLCEWTWFTARDPSELRDDFADARIASEIEAGGTDSLFEGFPMEPYVRPGPKVGRNDPCPCGSGKKYKKCCLPADGG